jgi:hypothetical protein
MTSSTSNKGIAAIVGVGPKLGRSIARKFAHEGYTVAILARDLGTLSSSLILYPSLVFAPKKKIGETDYQRYFIEKNSISLASNQ